ncbi:nucleoplasmin-like protein [Drosophila innubila]|uniref:nucleoplasmin-like protein n=1 Tax=Drosophila innubila TaxID=198719 RepID=UPI00148E0B6C|nr:nucleoplasmin-like protein [Drosophila innubila]
MEANDQIFFGCTLSDTNTCATWDLIKEDDFRCNKLVIKQILLDADAKNDEYNVVEVMSSRDLVKIPIAVLKAGEQRMAIPDLEFYESNVTFSLIRGSGPVHMCGHIVREYVDIMYVSKDGHQTHKYPRLS